jgi:hypothetical protein
LIKLPLLDRFKFFVERQFVKGAGFQLLVVAAVIAALALLGGIALLASGADMPLADAIWWAFLRMTDPGYLGDDEGIWRRAISTLMTLTGYVVFLGALVAIMTQWLIARMRELERGLTPVTLSQHLVIVGWTNRTLPLIRELLGNDRHRRRFRDAFGARQVRAVVMSEEVSPLQLQALRADPKIGRKTAMNVVLRFGSVLEEEAIRRAGCLNAAAVIMPIDYGRGRELVSPDVQVIRALLSMDAGAARIGEKPPMVVAEISDERRAEMVRNAYTGLLEIVASDNVFNRLVLQSFLHPGLPQFLREVLSARVGNELMLGHVGRMAGARLSDLASCCPRAIVLGLLSKTEGGYVARLAGDSSERLQPNDLIVFLARSRADIQPGPASGRALPAIARPMPAQRSHRAAKATRLLVLGWSRRVPNLIAELASYPGMHFEVDTLSIVDMAQRRREVESYSRRCGEVKVQYLEGDYLLSGQLDRSTLSHYDAVLLLSSDLLETAEEADARVVVGQRLVRSLIEGLVPAPQILVELADSANEGLVDSNSSGVLISPILLSHMLAQVALRPEMKLVFDELFTEGGAEIDFRAARAVGLSGQLSFGELERRVGKQGEILMGVKNADPKTGKTELMLNPARDTVLEVTPTTQLCVLTRISGR